MKIKMFNGKRKVVYSLLAAAILSSSAASAAGYYPTITYGTSNNRGYTITYYYNYGSNNNNGYNNNNNVNNNTNNNTNNTVAQYPQWTWTVITPSNNSNTRPGTVIELPTPTRPNNNSNTNNNQISGLSEFEAEVVRLVNIERQKAGLQPLQASVELSNVARKKSEDMAKNNYFSHTSPTYGSPFDMMKSFGIKYNTAGENIAKGHLTPQSVVNAWMNSSGHRANILNSSFKKIGVGFYKSSNGTNYWTQMFTN